MNSIKIVLVGDTKVGKTCICQQLTEGRVLPNNPSTIGASFRTHVIQTETESLSIQIWDTVGQEKYRAISPMYYRLASIVFLVFDLTNETSFHSLNEWVGEITEKSQPNIKIVLVGNKCDLVDERRIPLDLALSFADSIKAIFYTETSATTGKGIVDLFVRSTQCVSQSMKANQSLCITNDTKPASTKSGCC